MPIIQFHKRPARIDSGLPELARLRKGAPRQSDNQKNIPSDLTHFRLDANDLPTVSASDIEAAWVDLYGEQPGVIRNVQFAVDRLDLAFDSWLESWTRSKNGTPLLNKRCDGQTIIFERDGDKVYREPVACEHKCDCKPTGRLRMFLPDLCARLGVLGVVTLITHASTDIDNLANSLNLVYSQTGRLRNVAFVLYRETVQLMSPAGLPVKKSIVRLELDTRSAQAVALAAGEALALPAVSTPRPIENRPALPAPDMADDAPDEYEDDAPPPSQVNMPPDLYDDEDDEPAPQGMPDRLIGTATRLEIRSTGKGRSYHLRVQNGTPNGASLLLQGFDGIRAISEWWHAYADAWKTEDFGPGDHAIPPLKVYTGAGGLRFEGDIQPSTARLS
jgi:hypothetical protein